MKVNYTSEFIKKLAHQVNYIAIDKPFTARKFKNELLAKAEKTKNLPYSYRKSIFFDDDSIRDLVFKGYCIVFRIKNNSITIFSLVKYEAY